MQRIWLQSYPPSVPAVVDTTVYPSLTALIEEGLTKFATQPAYKYLGHTLHFADIDRLSRQFAAYLQAAGLNRGDRVAVMLPNLPQYPVVTAGILRAGMVVVNVNPLYTPRELQHQLKDSGARMIVVLENFAHVVQHARAAVPGIQVVLAAMGDLLPAPKRWLVDYAVRKVKKLVPPYQLSDAVRFNAALRRGKSATYRRPTIGVEDVAVLQYTGGTTGVSKGATLLHRNLVANVLQGHAWNGPLLAKIPPDQQLVAIAALPLYHIFGFTMNMLIGFHLGSCNVLIPNPRDITALLKELTRHKFHTFPSVNTLFNAILHHPDFGRVDWSHMLASPSGGMAVLQATARQWKEKTGAPIVEGYGLSETSPFASSNQPDFEVTCGNIGYPLPNTELAILDDEGKHLPAGETGEIAIRGPQVMAGYWQRPDETAKVMTSDGFFRTGDIGMMDADGRFRIVDRKKDMVLVSGFNVYPNEIEDVIAQMPGVLECAAIGMPDANSGEAVRVFVVRSNPQLSEAELRKWCEQNLTGYKRPKRVDFIDELPKSPVGKILRRELRDKYAAAA